MMKLKEMSSTLLVLTFTCTLFCVVNAQAPAENMKTFFDSEFPGIRIQVNATTETQPTENVTVKLSLKGLVNVYVEHFNLSVFGFLNGTYKIAMANTTDNDFSLNDTLREYDLTFDVPEQVWGTTYGEIIITYRAILGGLELRFPQLTFGFTMTYVENTYLKKLENDLGNWIADYQQLNSTFEQLNQTYWELQQNYTALQGSINELDNTRRAMAILAITTVFFIATTVYMVMRKPREYW